MVFAATFIVLISSLPARCQVGVQEGVSTDTVDLFGGVSRPQKSAVLAMCASIVLPGLGHQYLGDNTRALTYYSAEALFLFGAFFCNHYSQTVFNNAKIFAWEHAEVQGGPGADYQFWQNVANYDEADGPNQSISLGYNKEMELIYRDQSHDYLAPNLQWQWDDPSNRTTYAGLLVQSNTWKVASSFFIGAMVLDRLIAFIDTRITARRMETQPQSSILVLPQFDPIARASGLTLRAGF